MSNLGMYQRITTASKKVGGPVNFILLIGAAGAAAYKLCEIGVKKGGLAIKSHIDSKNKIDTSTKNIYHVTSDGVSNEGVSLVVGNQYRVLERDGDSVLVEIIGDNNNPYFMSADFLRSVSDFLE